MTDVHGFLTPKAIKYLPTTETERTRMVPVKVQKSSITESILRHRKARHSVQPSVERSFMPGTEKAVPGTAGMAIPSRFVTQPGTSTYSRTWIQSA